MYISCLEKLEELPHFKMSREPISCSRRMPKVYKFLEPRRHESIAWRIGNIQAKTHEFEDVACQGDPGPMSCGASGRTWANKLWRTKENLDQVDVKLRLWLAKRHAGQRVTSSRLWLVKGQAKVARRSSHYPKIIMKGHKLVPKP